MQSPSSRQRNNKNIKTLAGNCETNEESSAASAAKNVQVAPTDRPEAIFIEPFYGGSHKQLIDTLIKHVPNSHLITLTAKKWHWRARCGSLAISTLVPPATTERTLFCSSIVSLAELLGLRADLQPLKKVVYFHENQLVYPIRDIKQRDVQFAYNQITTCLAADVVVFNSAYNRSSFLDNIPNIVRMFPDNKPRGLRSRIEPKCAVLYFPLEFGAFAVGADRGAVVHIVWPHRWEFDKDPESFVDVLMRLKADNHSFRVSMLGEAFADVPEIFVEAKDLLKDEIVNYGFIDDKNEYYRVLQSCHLAVSTAKHEFFGVSMLEASYCGCFPLVPRRLVYPEMYPSKCLYSDENELYLRLKQYCLVPDLALEHRSEMNLDFDRFSVDNLLSEYLKLFT